MTDSFKQALSHALSKPLGGVSVGRRLTRLVILQMIIVAVLAFIAIHGIRSVATDAEQMYRFQLLSIADIGTALERAAELQSLLRQRTLRLSTEVTAEAIPELLYQLHAFYQRYANQWEVAQASSPNALTFRSDVIQAGESRLFDRERDTLDQLKDSLKKIAMNADTTYSEKELRSRWTQAVQLRNRLSSLFDLNIEYARISHNAVAQRTREATIWLVMIGLSGPLLLLLQGLHVYRAITPRIERLVWKVDRFKDSGVNEQVANGGNDDIAVLANALDAGFLAISAREREREEFLAVIAHELKTPMMSIQGFSSMLLSKGSNNETTEKALRIIHNQAWRLSRLVEALFLSMKARAKQLRFYPTSFDLSALTRNILQEIRPFIPSQRFEMHLEQSIRILGDQTLLEHSLWSLFTCAFALSDRDSPLEIQLVLADRQASLTVKMTNQTLSTQELETIFSPFRGVEYEMDSETRATVGLYLSREIAKLHGGTLLVQNKPGSGTIFSMDLPT